MRILFTACIFLSAFLLFLVQPIIAKEIMPWFGGTSAVWTTCLMFFQLVLLAGYTYSDTVTRWLKPRSLSIVHIVLLLCAVVSLPIIPNEFLKPASSGEPIVQALKVLLATVGLPYFCLATTGPLLQSWFSHFFPEKNVYRLFALSNLASLVALLSYPFIIEPYSSSIQQSYWWSAGFCLFAVLCAASAWISRNRVATIPVATASTAHNDAPPSAIDYIVWLTLSAMGSMLLLAVTNHVTQNIASVPFLWLLPLSIYLLTFILCFDGKGWYRRPIFVVPLLCLPLLMAWGLCTPTTEMTIGMSVLMYIVGFFFCCMFFHGELHHRKPAARYLTRFYLALSSGGALGGILIGAVAPYVFDNYYELPVLLFSTSLLVCALLMKYLTASKIRFILFILAIFSSFLNSLIGWHFYALQNSDNVIMRRNFYGALRVMEELGLPGGVTKILFNGAILHGSQIQTAERSRIPTTYYGASSGIGYAMRRHGDVPQTIGLIGLGAGTMAAYGKPGDNFRFYEINALSKDIAEQQFTYLKDSPASHAIVLGDARLSLEAELKNGQPGHFDVLVVDAFSGDAIPVHLITREAMALYRKHMKPNGIIAFHVSNLYLDLPPVVAQLAENAGSHAIYIYDEARYPQNSSKWVLVTDDQAFLNDPALLAKSKSITSIPGLKLWTDSYNNLFTILKK